MPPCRTLSPPVRSARARSCAHAGGLSTASGRAHTPGLVGVVGTEDRAERLEDDVEVEPHRPVVDVVEIVLDALADLVDRVGLATPAVDLRPAGDAGLHAVA